ncbi:MAG TPA: nucleotidyltransferase family protein [Verrucomicrobiae bacterium]|nr:nucleotidyltransferase family protein [Verrucomicrobiae bacterium]
MPAAKNHLKVLADLLLHGDQRCQTSAIVEPEIANQNKAPDLSAFGQSDLDDLTALANKHHVIVRSFEALCNVMADEEDYNCSNEVVQTIDAERARIAHALGFLDRVCIACNSEGCDVVVIKSLDHWPDLGGDLDVFTTSRPADVIRVMRRHFNARLAERSWGDRLANKWNFIIPGLPELIEFHVGRLGQTGEQVDLAKGLRERAVLAEFGEHSFRVPAAEDRLIVSTLQRMYRHFYFRLCDIVDTVRLVESHAVDYEQLRSSAKKAGVWEGTATYLSIVSDYVKLHRGDGIDIPSFVRTAARFGGDQVSVRNDFLRVPIVPHSVKLFISELGKLVVSGDVRGTARLSLFPGLAAAAALGYKLTGSDKGIW